MNEFDAIKLYFKNKMWSPIAQFLITMIATVLLDLTYAIVIGDILSFAIYGADMLKLGKKREKLTACKELADGNATVNVSGVCFFANSDKLLGTVSELREAMSVEIDLGALVYADFTACETLAEVCESFEANGTAVTFRNAPENTIKTLKRIGVNI